MVSNLIEASSNSLKLLSLISPDGKSDSAINWLRSKLNNDANLSLITEFSLLSNRFVNLCLILIAISFCSLIFCALLFSAIFINVSSLTLIALRSEDILTAVSVSISASRSLANFFLNLLIWVLYPPSIEAITREFKISINLLVSLSLVKASLLLII